MYFVDTVGPRYHDSQGTDGNISSIPGSGVIMDGDIGESPMVKLMGDIRELFADSRCHFNKINLDFYTPFC